MAVARAKPEVVAVLDVGKTNVKLLAIAPGGGILSFRSAPNEVRSRGRYPSCDVEHIWRWLLAALADLAEHFRIRAIVPTTYGSSAALVDERQLVLPVLDYEAEPPPEIAQAYAEVAPWFDECCCPILPAGLTLARQLFWLSRAFSEEFARARWILPFPQYWAWRLSGVPASEVTSLGAQTQLWNPRERDLSGLAKREGWEEKIPPLRSAFDVLGALQADLARRAGLAEDTAVLCGIHDSNANLARYLAAGLEDVSLISTGTWLITFNPSLPLSGLDPLRDCVSNTDLLGRPVASARFMGGREYAEIAGRDGLAAQPSVAAVAALVEAGTMALPSFTDSGGPFPKSGHRGRVIGAAASPDARAALASLYVALMADVGLELMRSENPIVIDGSFAENPLFCGLLAALRPGQRVAVSIEREGTALGAALLWGWAERPAPVPLELRRVEPLEVTGLHAYADRWRAEAESAGHG
jgi:L-fuculokinase